MQMVRTVGLREADPFAVQIAKQTPALRNLARMLTRNEEAAADLTQDTLAKAWKARNSFASGTNLRAWLATIMRNHFRSEARRSWRQAPWDQTSAEGIAAPGSQQLDVIELKDAVRAISTLSNHQRDAIILAAVGGLSSENAGAIIGCRPAAMKSRILRARSAVRSMLEGKEPLNKPRGKNDSTDALVTRLKVLTAGSERSPRAADLRRQLVLIHEYELATE